MIFYIGVLLLLAIVVYGLVKAKNGRLNWVIITAFVLLGGVMFPVVDCVITNEMLNSPLIPESVRQDVSKSIPIDWLILTSIITIIYVLGVFWQKQRIRKWTKI